MEFKDAYNLMDIELKCVRRNSTHTCNRECDKCDLVQKDTDLIEAYQMAKFALKFFGEMREMTPEESEAHSRYISSISTPTGVNIWDVLDKADNVTIMQILMN